MFMSYVDEVKMHLTSSHASFFERGHWVVVSLFLFTTLSAGVKGDSITGTKKLRDQGVFSDGKKVKDYCYIIYIFGR